MANRLPVEEIIPLLKKTLDTNVRVLLQAPPGAGKSTYVPLQLLDEWWLKGKKILMLEPRRLAARALAHHMAAQRNESVSDTVGYSVRFERKVSGKTRLEIVTEGILVRMLQSDNALEDVGLVIFDEFHERSIHADLSLALMLHMQELLRPDMRILIMSATLDSKSITSVLGEIPVVTSEGKSYPVELIYLDRAPSPNMRIHELAAQGVRQALTGQSGDVLVFLPGVAEINRTAEIIERWNTGCRVCPLYGELKFELQQAAILPDGGGRRKIILATSIAETSLTIEGITTVVDAGYARFVRFDPRSGLTRLETDRATQDSVTQRAGRAGRLGPGVCYRMWTRAQQAMLRPHRTPEIMEADLASLMLELMQWGVNDVNELTWITTPPEGHVRQAADLLRMLGASDERGINNRGKRMLALAAHPRFAHMLLEAAEYKLEPLAADVAALLEERDPLDNERSADLSLRVQTLRRWRDGQPVMGHHSVLERVGKLAASWRKLLGVSEDNTAVSDEWIGFLLAAAYPDRVARRMSGDRYKLANGRTGSLPASDPLSREEWLGVGLMDAGVNEGRIYSAAPLAIERLQHIWKRRYSVRWDTEREILVSAEEYCIGHLVAKSMVAPSPPESERKKVICAMIRERGLKILGWGEHAEQWQNRILCLQMWLPEERWPEVKTDYLLMNLEDWLWPFIQHCSRLTEMQQVGLEEPLRNLLPWDKQSKLETLAPERLEVPTGSMIRLEYSSDGSDPVLEVRLQEVFGWLDTPRICHGKIAVKMRLLSPGYRPIQITQDLNSFWRTTYHEVRKELRARYPKHSWPEDPLSAEPVRGAKRRKTS
jgi:ATP-dependent helicase HrpB